MMITTAHAVEALVHQSLDEFDASRNSIRQAEANFDPDSQALFKTKLIYKMLISEWEATENEAAREDRNALNCKSVFCQTQYSEYLKRTVL